MVQAAPAVALDGRRPRKAALRVAVASAALWAFSNAVLCHAAYESSVRPVPGTPQAGPIPVGDWKTVAAAMLALALALAPGPAVALVAGLKYLRSVSLAGWTWLTSLAVAAAAGVTVEALLVSGVVLYFQPGPWPARVDTGAKELALGFVASGVAMLAVMILAARSVSRRSPS